jgi:hypothetical protein
MDHAEGDALRGASMRAPADWLPAFDDGLVGRLHRCTLCGQVRGRGAWWDIMQYASVAVAVILCEQCRTSDPEREALDALLKARYEPYM